MSASKHPPHPPVRRFSPPPLETEEPAARFGRRARLWARRVSRWTVRLVVLLAGTALLLTQAAAPLAEAVGERAGRALVRAAAYELQLPEPPDLRPLSSLERPSAVVDAAGRDVTELRGALRHHPVALEDLPDHVWQAVLAAEDRRFFSHEGYDPVAMGRATLANLRAREIVQGGSTITQQLAKTIVGAEPTFERKHEELLVALALEERYDKHTLLEHYLNTVYFGAGAYGIGAAADEFFGTEAASLSRNEAALLAGLIRSPNRLDPRAHPERVEARRNVVLAGMAEHGWLARADLRNTQDAPLGVVPAREPLEVHPHLAAAAKREFLANPAFGDTTLERAELLFHGGVEIELTVDLELQRAGERIVAERFPERDEVTGAIAAVDPRTGEIAALVSGRDFDDEQYNLALQGRRQPGSAFKTFVLAAGLEQRIPLDTSLEGRSGATFGTRRSTGPWATRGVRNYGGQSFSDPDARTALVRSVNTAFADLVLRVGMDRVTDLTDRLGIDRSAYGRTASPASALGGLDEGVTALEMASAYGTFAAGGEHVEPYLIRRVTGPDGEVLHEAEPTPEQVLAPEVNAAMREVLREVVTRGTGRRAELPGWEVIGKTGTTQEHRDVWFAGATPRLAAAAWVGHPDERVQLWGMSSSGTAAPLWHAFMDRALRGVDPEPYPDAGMSPPAELLGDDDEDDEED